MFGLSKKELDELLSGRPIPPVYWRRTAFEFVFLVAMNLALMAWAIHDYLYTEQSDFFKYTDLFRYVIAAWAAVVISRRIQPAWRRYKEALNEQRKTTQTNPEL